MCARAGGRTGSLRGTATGRHDVRARGWLGSSVRRNQMWPSRCGLFCGTQFPSICPRGGARGMDGRGGPAFSAQPSPPAATVRSARRLVPPFPSHPGYQIVPRATNNVSFFFLLQRGVWGVDTRTVFDIFTQREPKGANQATTIDRFQAEQMLLDANKIRFELCCPCKTSSALPLLKTISCAPKKILLKLFAMF